MARIDYRKAYDFVPHSWILECLYMLGIADNVRSFLEKSMKKWKLLLTSNGSDLSRLTSIEASSKEIAYRHCMIPLSLLLRKVKASYEWGRKEFKLNHLLFMDDLKFFGKSDDQVDSLV